MRERKFVKDLIRKKLKKIVTIIRIRFCSKNVSEADSSHSNGMW